MPFLFPYVSVTFELLNRVTDCYWIVEKRKNLLSIYNYRLCKIKRATLEIFGYVTVCDDKGPVGINM